MDKLRKIGRWLWFNKERMVLMVVVVILVYRVYVVVYPPLPPAEKRLAGPSNNLEDIPEDKRPPVPGMAPVTRIPGNYTDLYKRNPFLYDTSGRKDDKDNTVTPEDLGLELLAIREVNGVLKVQLNTRSVKKRWYPEGAEFEEYKVESVDAANQTAKIYAVKYNRSFDLSVKQQ